MVEETSKLLSEVEELLTKLNFVNRELCEILIIRTRNNEKGDYSFTGECKKIELKRKET